MLHVWLNCGHVWMVRSVRWWWRILIRQLGGMHLHRDNSQTPYVEKYFRNITNWVLRRGRLGSGPRRRRRQLLRRTLGIVGHWRSCGSREKRKEGEGRRRGLSTAAGGGQSQRGGDRDGWCCKMMLA